MKFPESHFFSKYLLFSSFVYLVSCETSTNSINKDVDHGESKLKIGLSENIKSLIPFEMSNTSELFIGSQLFEGLFGKNSKNEVVPQLVQEYFLDTLNKTYHFTLGENKKWSDGSRVKTNDIYNCFKSIVKKPNSNTFIQSFTRNVSLYSKAGRETKMENSLYGFKSIDDRKFTLKVNELDSGLFQKLADYRFWMYKKTSNKEIKGSGPFRVENTNDDISFNLDRNPHYSGEKKENTFSGIDIRFIKNTNALIDEFLKGSIDAIEYNSSDNEITELENVKNDKYGYKNYVEQMKTSVLYLVFRNFKGTEQIRPVLKKFTSHTLLKGEEWMNLNTVDSTITPELALNESDSLKTSEIHAVYNNPTDSIQLSQLINSEFSPEIKLILTNLDKVNHNVEYIVIKNGVFDISETTLNENIFKMMQPMIYQEKQNTVVAAVCIKRNLVMFDQRIKGFTQYGNWSKDIKNLTYSEPLTF